MKPFFEELFAYNHQANRQLCDAFMSHEDRVSEKSIALFSHMLNAHQIWNNRILPRQRQWGVWDRHSIVEFAQIDADNYACTVHLLQTCELNASSNYTNSRGKAFKSCTRDILFHIINHSTYHRGQIAVEFRRSGIEPVPTDYIFYKR